MHERAVDLEMYKTVFPTAFNELTFLAADIRIDMI